MKIVSVFSLILILAVSSATQEVVLKEGVIHKQFEEGEFPMTIQVAKGDRTGAILMTAWVTTGVQGTSPTGVNWIKYSDVDNLYFFVNFTALYSTKVRFRLIITGPEFYEYTSQNWIPATYKTCSYWYKWGKKSEFFKSKGVYKMVMIAEQEKAYGGEDCVATCTFRVY